MRESYFVNPHGLPDERQQTSARDMAILARALLREFPEQADLFDIGAIQYGRRVMRNHNGLIGRYPGADGMKTGFICASGFNVVASANRDGRRLITVVLGSPSANERTMKAADLFDRGFSSRATFISPTLESLAASSLQAPPNMRSVICDRRGPMPGEDDQGTVSAESGPNLFSSGIFAFAGGSGVDSIRRTQLGPRAPVSPIRVWVGLNPPGAAELATQAAEEDAADKAAKASPKKANRKTAAKEMKLPTGAIDDKGKAGRATLTLKPVSEKAKPVAAKTEKAKPEAKAPAGPLKISPDPKRTPAKPEVKAEATAKPSPKAN